MCAAAAANLFRLWCGRVLLLRLLLLEELLPKL